MEALATFLGYISTSVTSLQGIVTGWLTVALDNPAIFVMVIAVPMCYFGVKVIQRLFNLN